MIPAADPRPISTFQLIKAARHRLALGAQVGEAAPRSARRPVFDSTLSPTRLGHCGAHFALADRWDDLQRIAAALIERESRHRPAGTGTQLLSEIAVRDPEGNECRKTANHLVAATHS